MRIVAVLAVLVCLSWGQVTGPKSAPAKPAAKAGTTAPKSAVTPSSPDVDEGSLEDGVYTSDFFRFTYTLPEGFEVDENFLSDLEDQSNSTFVLLAAEGPLSGEDRRDVVVIVADKEATTAETYIAKVENDYAKKQGFEVLKPAYSVTIGGRPFMREDFRKEGTYQTAVFTILKGYAVGFSLAAPNVEAMQAVVESLNSVKFLNASARPNLTQKTPSPKPSTPSPKKGSPPVKPR